MSKDIAKQLLEPFDPYSLEWRELGDRYRVSSNGVIVNMSTHRVVKQTLHKSGYKVVRLYLENKWNWALAHRVIAKLFLTNPKNKPQVNHKNGVKQDNRVENLEWSTSSENNKHAHQIGLNRISDANKKARVVAVKQRLSTPIRCIVHGDIYPSQAECAKNLGISQSSISLNIRGKCISVAGHKFNNIEV